MAVRHNLSSFGFDNAGIQPLAELTTPSGEVMDDILGMKTPDIQPLNIQPLTLEFAQ